MKTFLTIAVTAVFGFILVQCDKHEINTANKSERATTAEEVILNADPALHDQLYGSQEKIGDDIVLVIPGFYKDACFDADYIAAMCCLAGGVCYVEVIADKPTPNTNGGNNQGGTNQENWDKLFPNDGSRRTFLGKELEPELDAEGNLVGGNFEVHDIVLN